MFEGVSVNHFRWFECILCFVFVLLSREGVFQAVRVWGLGLSFRL